MNLLLVTRDGRIITPESDSILEGITRDSVLQLARDRGLRTEQRKVTLQEWIDGVASGEIVEAFACGTAAVITPIAELKGEHVSITMPEPRASASRCRCARSSPTSSTAVSRPPRLDAPPRLSAAGCEA